MSILYLLCRWLIRHYLLWEAAVDRHGYRPFVYSPFIEIPPEWMARLHDPLPKECECVNCQHNV